MRHALARVMAIVLGLFLLAPISAHVAVAALRDGTIKISPTTYYTGDTVKITADFPTSTTDGQVYGNYPLLTLYADNNDGTFLPVAGQTGLKSSSSGVYTFSYVVTKVHNVKVMNDVNPAYAGGGQVTTPVLALTPKLRQTAELFMQRDLGTGNIKVTGKLAPGVAGQLVALQYLSGSSWKQIGAKLTDTDGDGTITETYDPATLTLTSQWSAKQFRIVADATGPYVSVTSPAIQFMPGPTDLGKYVMRIRTTNNVNPSKKGVEIPGTATMETNGGASQTAALEYIDLRGSSTAGYAKKPYKLKFATDTQPFSYPGLAKAARFNLLAMFLDNGLVRDKMGLDLGRKLKPNLEWTPGNLYAEVFVNDLYVGAYLVTDASKITDSSNASKQRIQVPDTKKGALLTVDGNSVSSGLFGFKTSHGIVSVFDDPDERKYEADGVTVSEKGVTDAKVAAMKEKVNALEAVLYRSNKGTGFLADVEKYLNVDSAIDYYLVKEFTRDHDADFYRSHYFYIKDLFVDPVTNPNGRITFGPVWDFDRSAGIISDTSSAAKYASSYQGWYLRPGTVYTSSHKTHNTHWFVQLTKSAEFMAKLSLRWDAVKSKFAAVGGASKDDLTSDVNKARDALGVARFNDWTRWASVTKRYALRSSPKSIDGEMDYASQWYRNRFAWMDANIPAPAP